MNIFSTLPKAIINEKIMPYTYQPQPKCLIKDIKTLIFIYRNILKMVDALYEDDDDMGFLPPTVRGNAAHISVIKYDVVYYYCEKILNMNRDSIEFYSHVNYIIEKKNKNENVILKILIEMTPLDRLKYLIKLSKEGLTV